MPGAVHPWAVLLAKLELDGEPAIACPQGRRSGKQRILVRLLDVQTSVQGSLKKIIKQTAADKLAQATYQRDEDGLEAEEAEEEKQRKRMMTCEILQAYHGDAEE